MLAHTQFIDEACALKGQFNILLMILSVTRMRLHVFCATSIPFTGIFKNFQMAQKMDVSIHNGIMPTEEVASW
jgi:hypothetical protein